MYADYYLTHSISECKILIKDCIQKFNIFIVISDIIKPLKALATINDDNTYTIVIKPDMTDEDKIKAVLHELDHIFQDDFHSDLPADEIERIRHID